MKTRENELLFISVFIDLLLLNGIFFLLFLTVFHTTSFTEPGTYFAFLALNLARILSFFILRKQVIYFKKGFRPRFYRMLKRAVLFIFLVALIYLPMCGTFNVSPCPLMLSSVFTFLFLKLGFNYTYFHLVKRRVKYSSRKRKVLLLGDNEVMTLIRKMIKINPQLNFWYEDTYITNATSDCEKVYADLEEKVLRDGVQVMFIAVDKVDDEFAGCWNLRELLRNCNRWGVRLFLVPKVAPDPDEDLKIDKLNHLLIYNPQRIPLDIAENQIKKRLFDMLFAGAFIVFVLSWLFPLMALIIKLSSRGPVLFIQPRTGINNRTFNCYKFRSMRVNGEAHQKQATADDPRITGIGRFMRRTNIDELPQFFNVLLGDMSVVGPRPHMLAHTELFTREVENYLVRHYVKPGITGWAQVNGFRGETRELWQIEKRVQYDHEYIRNWSFDWDFVIVWKTMFSLKAFRNAA
jgi:putative colanic acid biosynthesis UDP-glucose lipid carrier transferase